MKKHLLILFVSTLVIPVIAQETNEFRHSDGERRQERKKGEYSDRGNKQGRHEMSPEQKEKMKERRLQLMEKSLDKIGISEEQRTQIHELQKKHHEKMKEVSQKVAEMRAAVSKLEDAGASEAEVDAAIDALSIAQSEQLKVLVRNRREMEKILGKEKNALFMESARSQFRKHGRRGGSGMPPLPNSIGDDNKPPKPPAGVEEIAPPTP
jgi:hypothetical protein